MVSVAHAVPPHRVSSEWIDDQLSQTMDRLGVHKGLLEQLSGIVARKFWDEGIQPSDVAADAARQARRRQGLRLNRSACSSAPRFARQIEPSTACIVHGKLEALERLHQLRPRQRVPRLHERHGHGGAPHRDGSD